MPADRLFCSECGAANDPDGAFCESCGHPLAQADAQVGGADEVQYEEVAEAVPPPARRVSPRILAIVGLVVVAGAAYALRAPITSFIASKKGPGPVVAADSDSVQLATAPANPQFNDRAVRGDSMMELTPEMLQRVTGGAEPTITVIRTPRSPAPQLRTPQSRAQQSTNQSTVRPTRSMPQPEAPPDFPEFKAPPPSTASGTVSAPAGDSRLGHEAPPQVAAVGRIPAGSVLSLKSAAQVCTDKTQVGARFNAIVQQDVAGSNGAAIPAGTPVTFVVDRLKHAQNANEKNEFSVAPESIDLSGDRYPISATVDAVTVKKKSQSFLGALAGAATVIAITKASGGDTKQAVVGGVAGGAAGAVIGNQIRGGDGCIEKNASIRITLGNDITVR
jgi:hypothetical protein